MELLTTISIIAVLLALLIPAVQRSREAGRRIQCTNHLRQLGLALSSYATDHAVFPSALSGVGTHNIVFGHHHHSPHVRLLPYLELRDVYNSINFIFPHDWHPFDGLPHNTTAYAQRLAVFLCPSDPFDQRTPGGNNYRWNIGVTPDEVAAQDGRVGGPFAAFNWFRDSAIIDGLSQTVAASERPRGDFNDSKYYLSGDYWYSPATNVRDAESATTMCQATGTANSGHVSTAGITWFHAGFHCTWYNHIAKPNSFSIPDCSISGHGAQLRRGVFSARSHHNSGVNVAFCDGSCKFIDSAIDLVVWRSLGTRAAQEPTPEGF